MNYIIAIAEEGSISKASERLFMAQSTLSQFLGNLERKLDSKLFVRTSTGVRPTEAGKLMIEYAYRERSEYHRLHDEIQDIEGLNGGSVILGISSFRGTFLLPDVLNTFRREYPGIHVVIVEANSMALEEMLRNGTIDIALIILPAQILKVPVKTVMRDEICIITSPSHPVMKHAKLSPPHSKSRITKYIDIKDASEFEFLLSDYDTILGRESRRIFREHARKLTTRNYRRSLRQLWGLKVWGLRSRITVQKRVSLRLNFCRWARRGRSWIWESASRREGITLRRLLLWETL